MPKRTQIFFCPTSALSGALPVEGGVAVAFSKEIAMAKNPEKKQKELEDQLAQRQSPIPRAEGFFCT